ncbi:MAG: endonuclease domain-containing protein [Bacteroidota bacterium]|nr:endonuclease domain-containing protein [Bacteroidota bacterium]
MNRRTIIPYSPHLKEYARQLRKHSTKSEIFMWKMLKGKELHGYDFHRQKPLDNYIADFFCHELMLAIELDGYTHFFEEVQQKDRRKQERLSELGVTVLRFTDDEVFNDTDNVFKVIENYITEYEMTHPRPLSRGE